MERIRAQSQGFQSKQPHIAAPHHCLFIPLHPTWQREWEREKHRPGTEAQRGTWQWIQALLGSVEQLCLIKCLASKKNGGGKRSTSQQSNTKRKAAEEEEGDGWWRDFDKSLNDRGIRYNESTDWWILRFKSRLFDLKRIRLCLFRSIAHWKSFQTASVPHASCTETVAFVAESSVLLKVDPFKPQITAMKSSTCCKKRFLICCV